LKLFFRVSVSLRYERLIFVRNKKALLAHQPEVLGLGRNNTIFNVSRTSITNQRFFIAKLERNSRFCKTLSRRCSLWLTLESANSELLGSPKIKAAVGRPNLFSVKESTCYTDIKQNYNIFFNNKKRLCSKAKKV
jgi:hypothetical protein